MESSIYMEEERRVNILLEDCRATFKECEEILVRKNHDYAGEEDFKNFKLCSAVGVTPQRGVLVRMMDKISRISTLIDDKKPMVKDERIEDTINDLINYSAILKSLIKNNVQ